MVQFTSITSIILLFVAAQGAVIRTNVNYHQDPETGSLDGTLIRRAGGDLVAETNVVRTSKKHKHLRPKHSNQSYGEENSYVEEDSYGQEESYGHEESDNYGKAGGSINMKAGIAPGAGLRVGGNVGDSGDASIEMNAEGLDDIKTPRGSLRLGENTGIDVDPSFSIPGVRMNAPSLGLNLGDFIFNPSVRMGASLNDEDSNY